MKTKNKEEKVQTTGFPPTTVKISKMINIKPKEQQKKQFAKDKKPQKSKINKTKTN